MVKLWEVHPGASLGAHRSGVPVRLVRLGPQWCAGRVRTLMGGGALIGVGKCSCGRRPMATYSGVVVVGRGVTGNHGHCAMVGGAVLLLL